MNGKNRIGFLFLVAVILLTGVFPLSAVDEQSDTPITPPIIRLNNTNLVVCNFLIIDTNNAVAEATFEGHNGITSGATIEIKLQRKVLFWWTDVSGGAWTDTINSYYGGVSHSLRLTKKGDYRAVFTITVRGSGGDPDVLTDTITDSYD